jgi:chemotaxis protein CheD
LVDDHEPVSGPTQPSSLDGAVDSDDRRINNDYNDYFNAQFGAKPYYLEPGESGCGDGAGEMLVATIGSGIVVTIHDKDLGIGGMAYLLIPDVILESFPHIERVDQDLIEKAFQPLENCIGQLKRMGAGKNRIRIRVMGGTSYQGDSVDRGTKNYVLVKEYLARKNLIVMSEDLNGPYLRRVHFFPRSGRAVRRILRRKNDYASIHEYENNFQSAFRSGK